MKEKSSLRFPVVLIHSLAAIALIFILIFLTKIIQSPKSAFSSQLEHRFQTEALLKGKIALQDHPFHVSNDWAWGTGKAYQLWGLGIPILRLPFEMVAKMCGAVGFPDRLVFLFYFGIISFLLLRSFTAFLSSEQLGFSERVSLILCVVFTSILMLSPPMIGMIRSRFGVYEEVVAYGNLWALSLIGFLLIYFCRPNFRVLMVLSFLAGFGVLIRVTLIFYGSTVFLLCLLFSKLAKNKWRTTILSICLFLICPSLTLFLNQMRFGSPIEFGYHLNLSGLPLNDFALRFGAPFQHEPFLRAAKELFSALFLNPALNNFDFFYPYFFRGQSPTIRFREFYFPTFDLYLLMCLLICLPVGAVIFKRDSKKIWRLENFPAFLSLLSWITFILLFFFYLKSPSLTSRYLMDFSPALSMATLATGMGLLLYPSRNRDKIFLVAAFMMTWSVWAFQMINPKLVIYTSAATAQNINSTTVKSALQLQNGFATREKPLPSLPTVYERGRIPPGYPANELFDIFSNGEGWRSSSDGLVAPITVLFFERAPCLTISVDTFGEKNLQKGLDSIRVKSNLIYMDRKEIKKAGDNFEIRFCRPPGQIEKYPPQMISVGWMDPEKLSVENPGFRLEKVEAESEVKN